MLIAHHLMTWQGWAKKQGQTLDLPTAFAEIRAAGYDGVEMGGDATTCGPAPQLLRQIAAAGLKLGAWSAGVTANPWPPATENFRKSIDYAAELGCSLVVVCGGFMGGRRTAIDSDYRIFAQNYAEADAIAGKAGVQLAFHPHRGCLVETAAEVDRFLRFHPTLKLCVDCGHLASCFDDPLVLLDAHPERVISLHLKDYTPANQQFTELGRGSVNLAGVLAWVRRRQWDGVISVERDDPPIPAVESGRISREHLSTLGF